MSHRPTDRSSLTGLDVLTRSEREVLNLRVAGLSISEIAAETDRSRHTVKNHITNTYDKLKVRTLMQTVAAYPELVGKR